MNSVAAIPNLSLHSSLLPFVAPATKQETPLDNIYVEDREAVANECGHKAEDTSEQDLLQAQQGFRTLDSRLQMFNSGYLSPWDLAWTSSDP